MIKLSVNLAVLMEEILTNILRGNNMDADKGGVWCFLNDDFLLIQWEDLKDLMNCNDISKPLRNEIKELLKERGIS